MLKSHFYFPVLSISALFSLFIVSACGGSANEKTDTSADNTVAYGTPVLDGSSSDDIWEKTDWRPLDQVWLGSKTEKADFSGRYKLAWDENNLYVLAEIVDDTLYDAHADGLEKYWDDDCLEIFIDEDASGGLHQYNHNAFAYHVALDGRVVDIGVDSNYRYYNEHVLCRRDTREGVSVWEAAVRVYDGNQFVETGTENIPKRLNQGKKIGFMLAYCDNDRSEERENFFGSRSIEGEDKNRGWIDASLFGTFVLAAP